MWAQAGFSPDMFWHQTPYHFQMVMGGVRKKMKSDADSEMSLAYHSGLFAAIAQSGKIKPLKHYLRSEPRKMSAKEMLANMRILAQRANRKAA
jgi:hypothetical protein